MKKQISLPLLLFLPVFTVFAQNQLRDYISFNSFAYGSFEPFQIVKESGKSPRFNMGAGSWSDDIHLGLMATISSPDNRLGARLEIAYQGWEGPASLVGDNAKIWVQPFDWVKLEMGKFRVDTLRGIIYDSDFLRYLAPDGEDEFQDRIFQRFYGGNNMFSDAVATGVLLSFTPLDGLYFGFMVNPPLSAKYENWMDDYDFDQSVPPRKIYPQDFKEVFLSGQYSVGYTFQDIGLVRVQYIGGTNNRYSPVKTPRLFMNHPGFNPDFDFGSPEYFLEAANYAQLKNPMSIQAAFSFWGINDLLAEIGIIYPLPVSDDAGWMQRPLKITLAGQYILNDLLLKAYFYTSFLGKDRSANNLDTLYTGFTIGSGLSVSYNLGFTAVGGDILVNFKAKDDWQRYDEIRNSLSPDLQAAYPSLDLTRVLHWGISGWIEKSFTNGGIKTGFAFAFPFRNAPLVVTIPIVFSFYI